MKSRSLSQRSTQGFTLIELLLVIGIIAILASIVIVAINPTKQLGDARNAQRRSDVNTILNAVYQYAIDNGGALPDSANIPTTAATAKIICQSDLATPNCNNAVGGTPAGISGVSLRALSGTYIVSVPRDPSLTSAQTATGSRYSIWKDSVNNRVTITATTTDRAVPISASR